MALQQAASAAPERRRGCAGAHVHADSVVGAAGSRMPEADISAAGAAAPAAGSSALDGGGGGGGSAPDTAEPASDAAEPAPISWQPGAAPVEPDNAAAPNPSATPYGQLKARAGGGSYCTAWRQMRAEAGSIFAHWIAKPKELEDFKA